MWRSKRIEWARAISQICAHDVRTYGGTRARLFVYYYYCHGQNKKKERNDAFTRVLTLYRAIVLIGHTRPRFVSVLQAACIFSYLQVFRGTWHVIFRRVCWKNTNGYGLRVQTDWYNFFGKIYKTGFLVLKYYLYMTIDCKFKTFLLRYWSRVFILKLREYIVNTRRLIK